DALALQDADRAAFAAASRHPPTTSALPSSAPAAVETPPAIQTFLIADLRGYTRFTREQGDEAAAGLASRFAEIVRVVVERAPGQPRQPGRLLELRGDEALVAFASARAALRAAVALQARFAAEMAAHLEVPLGVGIGLDAGEAVPVADGYRGGTLNLA